MAKVGDRIRLSSGKGPDRDGVVTAVTGTMVRVRWPSGDETTVVPAPGTLSVLASSGDDAAAVTGVQGARAATGKAEPKKAPKKGTTKKTATGKKTETPTKGTAKKTSGAKRSSR
jgi:hypothetical protein